MPIVSPKTISDKSKTYKRFFVFGCSFTWYHWPTWANILHFDMPQSKFYNLAKPGGGNSFIYSQIIAANQKYKFTSDDLVAVMWSTHGREDRYVNHCWETPGNIWTQNYYDEKFLKKYSCLKGYLVRDLSIFQGTKIILNALPCDAIPMYSVPVDYDAQYTEYSIEGLKYLYKDIIEDMVPNLYYFNRDGSGGWVNGHKYIWPGVSTELFFDYHPSPGQYMTFLLGMKFELSDETRKYIQNTIMPELRDLTHRDLITNWGAEIYKNKHPGSVGYENANGTGVDIDDIDEIGKNKPTFPL